MKGICGGFVTQPKIRKPDMRTLLVLATVLASSSLTSAQSDSDEFQLISTNSYNALVERVSALEQEKSKGKTGTAAGLTAGADVVFLRPFGTDNGMPNHLPGGASRLGGLAGRQ